MNAYIVALIRTYAPILAGWLLSLAIARPLLQGLGLTDSTALAAAVSALLAALWYAVARTLEQRWPRLGVLLGVPKAPSYDAVLAAIDPAFVDSPNVPDLLLGAGATLLSDLTRPTGSTGLTAIPAVPPTPDAVTPAPATPAPTQPVVGPPAGSVS